MPFEWRDRKLFFSPFQKVEALTSIGDEKVSSQKPNRFRITSIIIAVAMTVIMIVPSAYMFSSDASESKVMVPDPVSTLTASDYEYYPQTVTFATSNTPTSTGLAILPNLVTAWGQVGLGRNWGRTLQNIKIGATSIPDFFDSYFTYTWDNGTQASSQPFHYPGIAGRWGNYWAILNNSHVGIWEKYAEGPATYTGSTPEWNMTLRFTIFKNEPIVRVDFWVRNLNTTGDVQLVCVYPIDFAADAGSVMSINVSRHLVVRTKGVYAIGVLTQRPVANPCAGGSDFGSSSYSEIRKVNNLWVHGSEYIFFGTNTNEIYALQDSVGSSWNSAQTRTNYNFYFTKNANKYDSMGFGSTNFTYYPTGTTETLLYNDVYTTVAFSPNPILNYIKAPLITSFDDLMTIFFTPSTQKTAFDNLVNTAKKYEYPISLGAILAPGNITDVALLDLYALTSLNGGALIEVVDHGWNHSSLSVYNSSAYASTIVSLSAARWATVSSIPIYTFFAPFNTWGEFSRAGISTANMKNMRTIDWQYDSIEPNEYNGLMAVYSFTAQQSLSRDIDMDVLEAQSYGFRGQMWHVDSIDDPSEQTALSILLSNVQNNTYLIPLTYAQFSDLYHHRLVYDLVNSKTQINMTTVEQSQMMYLSPTCSTGDVFEDTTSGAIVQNYNVSSSRIKWIAERGHVYEALPIKVAVSSGTMNLQMNNWIPSQGTSGHIVASWSTLHGSSSAVTTYTFSGLRGDVGYKVYQNDVEVHRQSSGATSLTFTVIGGSDYTIVVWAPMQSLYEMGEPMLIIGVTVGLVSIIIVAVGSRIRRG